MLELLALTLRTRAPWSSNVRRIVVVDAVVGAPWVRSQCGFNSPRRQRLKTRNFPSNRSRFDAESVDFLSKRCRCFDSLYVAGGDHCLAPDHAGKVT